MISDQHIALTRHLHHTDVDAQTNIPRHDTEDKDAKYVKHSIESPGILAKINIIIKKTHTSNPVLLQPNHIRCQSH